MKRRASNARLFVFPFGTRNAWNIHGILRMPLLNMLSNKYFEKYASDALQMFANNAASVASQQIFRKITNYLNVIHRNLTNSSFVLF